MEYIMIIKFRKFMNGILAYSLFSCLILNAGEKIEKRSKPLDIKQMVLECQKMEKAALEVYEREKDKDINESPYHVVFADLDYGDMETKFVRLAGKDTIPWIRGMEKYLLQRIKQKTVPSSLLWGPYIYVTMRDHPREGRMAIRNFVSRNNLPPIACLDFLGVLSRFLNSFMAREVIREKDIVAMLQRTLNDKSASYGYKTALMLEEGYDNVDDGKWYPAKYKIVKAKLRMCDWGCMFAFCWFNPKSIKYSVLSFVESSEKERDQVIAQMQEFLSGREKALAPTQALEDELRGQYAARMAVADFAAKLAEWQKRANDPTGDGTLQLLLDTLFYQVGRNAEAAMDDRDTQMTAYLAGKVSEIFAKDGLKILAGKEGENLRHKDDFFRFLNPLNVQLYEKKRPLDMARNAQLRILANIYEQKYHSGELFRLPEDKAETAPAGKAKTPAGGKPGK